MTATLYEPGGKMADVKMLPAGEKVGFAFDTGAGAGEEYVKTVWIDNDFRPLASSVGFTGGSAAAAAEDGGGYLAEHTAQSLLEYGGEVFEAEYIDNELILAAADGVSRGEIESLIAPWGAAIDGGIESVGHWFITLSQAGDGASLSRIADELRKSPLLDGVYFNTVSDLELCAEFEPDYPSDSWETEDSAVRWNEGYPMGHNWGAEAINLPSARRLLADRNITAKVNVGIIDSMFDGAHPDLGSPGVWVREGKGFAPSGANAVRDLANNDKSICGTQDYVHGTHVAGTVAAEENGYGVTGVAAGHARLYCVGYCDAKGNKKFTVTEMENALEVLFKNAADKKIIINYSNVEKGKTRLFGSDTVCRSDVEAITEYLKGKLSGGYDFVIAAAAGNSDGRNAAEVSIFNAVTDQEVASRIIVVGAVNKYDEANLGKRVDEYGLRDLENYRFNYGDRIDVAAPGADIMSCVPPGCTAEAVRGTAPEYASMTGTSMAAPHAAGTAALVWAANRNLTGAQVKRLILDTADIRLANDGRIKMINAAGAVARALETDFVPGGRCGDSLYWQLDADGETLTIRGTGDMYDFAQGSADVPWYKYLADVRKVVIGDKATCIGDRAFTHSGSALRSVELGASVVRIGDSAFEGCTALTQVSAFPEGLKEIGLRAFYNTAAQEFVFKAPSPDIAAAEKSSADRSFSVGSAPNVTLYYPARYSQNWDPQGEKLWKGYIALPYGQVVRGNAVDSVTGEPVKGAAVSLTFGSASALELTAVTDDSGVFEFTPDIPGQRFVSLKIEHGDYLAKSTSGTIPEGGSLFEWKNIQMDRLYPVTVTVTDEDGAALPGAAVSVPSLPASTVTDSYGRCTFKAPNGTHSYTVKDRAGNTAQDSVTVNGAAAEKTTVVNSGAVVITIQTVNSSGIAVPDMEIAGTGLDYPPMTDSEGKAKLKLQPGKYTFTVYQGQFYGETEAEISEGALVSITLQSTFIKDWYLDDTKTVLTIVGSGGPMPNFSSSGDEAAPWTDHPMRATVKSVVLRDVTTVGSCAFYGMRGIEDITFPGSIRIIGGSAFSGCEGLEYITIPYGTGSIGYYAFSGCKNLKSAVVPSSVSIIESGAFSDCAALKSFTCSSQLKEIGYGVFKNCESLESAGFAGGIPNVPASLFENCGELKSAAIRDGAGSIGSYAFFNCGKLERLTVPASVTEVSESAFQGCAALTDAGPTGGGFDYEFGWKEEIPANAFRHTGIRKIDIPDSVTSIGRGAFAASGLTGVPLPPSLKLIEKETFRECEALTEVTIPEGVESIGESAFSGCAGLKHITVPGSVTDVGKDAFSGCTAFTSAGPAGGGYDFEFGWRDTVPYRACEGCTGLTEVVIPAPVRAIGSAAFPAGETLTHVVLPGTIERLGISYNSFYGCTSLTTAGPLGSGCNVEYAWTEELPRDTLSSFEYLTKVILDGFGTVTYLALEGMTQLTEVTVGESVSAIKGEAFKNCAQLTLVRLPDSLMSLGKGAFEGCPAITTAGPAGSGCSLELGWKEKIPDDVFRGCDYLESVIIPEGVKAIGSGAFGGCGNMAVAVLPGSLRDIGSSAFSRCKALEHIKMPEGLEAIEAAAFAGAGLKEVTVPEGVEVIAASTFSGCAALEKAVLPASLTSIEISAFSGCPITSAGPAGSGCGIIYGWSGAVPDKAFYNVAFLDRIVLPKDLRSIGAEAFYGNKALETIELPEGLEEIGRAAFFMCTALKGINVPASVTALPESAFERCSGLKAVHLNEGLVTIGRNAFSRCGSLEEIALPDSLREMGQGAFAGTGLKAVTIPEGVAVLEDYVLSGCDALESAVLPDSIEYVGKMAFYNSENMVSAGPPGSGCAIVLGWKTTIPEKAMMYQTQLKKLILPETVTQIGDSAFYYTFGITELTIPPLVKAIGDNAFGACSSLERVVFLCPDTPQMNDFQVFHSSTDITAYYPDMWSKRMKNYYHFTWVSYDPAVGPGE